MNRGVNEMAVKKTIIKQTCEKCGRSVSVADAKVYGRYMYHKSCCPKKRKYSR